MSDSPDGLAFFGSDLESNAWSYAERFAGPDGHVATLPNVIAARLATEPDVRQRRDAWDSYITTTSAEYAGISKGGTAILIVAHGVGPLATRATAIKKYQGARGRARNHGEEGVRISRDEFLKLESGVYGPVSIVPLEDVCGRYDYPFMTPLDLVCARREPLVAARLGPRWEEYLYQHDAFARGPWAASRRILDSAHILIALGQPRAWYALGGARARLDGFEPRRLDTYPKIGGPDPTEAFGHLLVAGALVNMHYSEHREPQIVTEIDCHNPGDGCRFLGLRKGANLAKIATAASPSDILARHWRDLLVPAKGKKVPMRPMKEVAPGTFLTTTLKDGHAMDTGVYEHPVRSAKCVGEGSFVTKVKGYYGFLRYDLEEVRAIAPAGANAYVLVDSGFEAVPGFDSHEHHRVTVRFYRAEIDLGHRVMWTAELESDFDLFVKFCAG